MLLEITSLWPTEVFIFRHYDAMRKGGYPIKILGRRAFDEIINPTSILNISGVRGAYIIPDFNTINLIEKIYSMRYITLKSIRAQVAKGWGDKVLMGYIERKQPKLIHFHTLNMARRMSWIPIQLDIPYTISLRGSDIRVMPLMISLDHIRSVLINAAGIHVVADALGRRACEIVQKEIDYSIIFTTVPIPTKYPNRYQLSKPVKKKLKFVSVGRLHWCKSYPLLVKAIKVMRDSGLDVNLALIGSGGDEERIRFWIKNFGLEKHIRLLGKLKASEVYEHLRSADAFIQSSVSEGLSNAMAEALSNGCPVFATSVGGTSEVINHGKNGYLLDTFKPETWACELLKATNAKEMHRIGKMGYETAKELFSYDVHYQKFSSFYDTVLNSWPGYEEIYSYRFVPKLIENQKPEFGLHRVLIQGDWNWRMGGDLILFAIYRTQSSKSHALFTFWGNGQQEDELKYLTEAMKLDAHVKFINSTVNERPDYGWELIINLREDDWLVEDVYGNNYLLSKDEMQLASFLDNHLYCPPNSA